MRLVQLVAHTRAIVTQTIPTNQPQIRVVEEVGDLVVEEDEGVVAVVDHPSRDINQALHLHYNYPMLKSHYET